MPAIILTLLASALSLASVDRAVSWIGPPQTQAALAGRVVIVDVFTFDCINCKHVVPELRRLYGSLSRKDLQIVGVHSPETPYERDRANVVENLRAQGIVWPVAIDNDFTLWKSFGIEYWPTQLVFDRHGRLRQTVIGEGQDALVDRIVHDLVAER